jgi:hypothetical protein
VCIHDCGKNSACKSVREVYFQTRAKHVSPYVGMAAIFLLNEQTRPEYKGFCLTRLERIATLIRRILQKCNINDVLQRLSIG